AEAARPNLTASRRLSCLVAWAKNRYHSASSSRYSLRPARTILRSLPIGSGTAPLARRAGRHFIFWVAAIAATVSILPWAAPAIAGGSAAAQPGAAHQIAAVVTKLDWPAYLFGARHPSATAGPSAITVRNAGSLTVAWRFREQPPTGPGQPPGGFSASPVVADGMVFIGSQTGDFYALRESTGKIGWKRTLDYEVVGHNGNCANVRGIVGTATVAADPHTSTPTVYAAGARYLYALNAATGAQDWKSLVGPAGSAKVAGAYFNYASPTV